MSRIIETPVGRFRAVVADGKHEWLWQCTCDEWGRLDDDQFNGRVSVDHASMGCPKGYHETHNYARELAIVVQTANLTPTDPFTEALNE